VFPSPFPGFFRIYVPPSADSRRGSPIGLPTSCFQTPLSPPARTFPLRGRRAKVMTPHDLLFFFPTPVISFPPVTSPLSTISHPALCSRLGPSVFSVPSVGRVFFCGSYIGWSPLANTAFCCFAPLGVVHPLPGQLLWPSSCGVRKVGRGSECFSGGDFPASKILGLRWFFWQSELCDVPKTTTRVFFFFFRPPQDPLFCCEFVRCFRGLFPVGLLEIGVN